MSETAKIAIPTARLGGADADPHFPNFRAARATMAESDVYVRIGGDGPPLLLLHGFPQTGAMWARCAPILAERFTLIIPDLQGYGRSRGPIGAEAYAKRRMSAEFVGMMRALGHERFRIAGHDRGGRVAYRAALDHPTAIERLAVLDIQPTYDYWARFGDRNFAVAIYHWAFLAQPYPAPETLIAGAPEFFIDKCLTDWSGREDLSAYEPWALAEYRANARNAATLRAMCDDYRAGADVDVAHDAADLEAGRRIQTPVLVLAGGAGIAAKASSPAAAWRRWCAEQPIAESLDCGHFMPEERPEATAEALLRFFT